MNTSIKQELLNHINDMLNDGVITDENIDELRYHCFNEDYYIIGYSAAEAWLKRHDISAFEAIETVAAYENDNFGSVNTAINAESIVNMYAYILGEEVIADLGTDLSNATVTEQIGRAHV